MVNCDRVFGVVDPYPNIIRSNCHLNDTTTTHEVKTESRKIEVIEVSTAVNSPNAATTHHKTTESSGHLIPFLPTKVVTEDLGTWVQPPYFVGVAIVVVAWTNSNQIERTGNLRERPQCSASCRTVDVASRI